MLKPGHRVCFCGSTNGAHYAEIYDGASKRLLGRLDHPQELTIEQLESFIIAKAAEHGLCAVMTIPEMPWNFYIVEP